MAITNGLTLNATLTLGQAGLGGASLWFEGDANQSVSGTGTSLG